MSATIVQIVCYMGNLHIARFQGGNEDRTSNPGCPFVNLYSFKPSLLKGLQTPWVQRRQLRLFAVDNCPLLDWLAFLVAWLVCWLVCCFLKIRSHPQLSVEITFSPSHPLEALVCDISAAGLNWMHCVSLCSPDFPALCVLTARWFYYVISYCVFIMAYNIFLKLYIAWEDPGDLSVLSLSVFTCRQNTDQIS